VFHVLGAGFALWTLWEFLQAFTKTVGYRRNIPRNRQRSLPVVVFDKADGVAETTQRRLVVGYFELTCTAIFSARTVILAIASVPIGGGDSPGKDCSRAMTAVSIAAEDLRTVTRNWASGGSSVMVVVSGSMRLSYASISKLPTYRPVQLGAKTALGESSLHVPCPRPKRNEQFAQVLQFPARLSTSEMQTCSVCGRCRPDSMTDCDCGARY
jgi:hypothetical protein